jgi:hypothetical protein
VTIAKPTSRNKLKDSARERRRFSMPPLTPFFVKKKKIMK